MTKHALIVCAAGLLCALSNHTQADIVGFNNGNGWVYNQLDPGTPASFGQDSVQITTGANQVRDIWFATPQAITQFTATFTYRAANIAGSSNPGVAFIIQNDPRGTAALAPGGFGFQGITPSAAVTIQLNTAVQQTATGFFRDGVMGAGSIATSPLNAFDGREIDVSIVYNGSTLAVSMHDSVNTFPTQTYIVSPSFASALGSSTALVGFGGSTAANGCNQFLSNFRFTVPSPATATVLLGGVATLSGRRRTPAG